MLEGYSKMVTDLSKPGEKIIEGITDPKDAHILHMAIGLVGEVVELGEAIQHIIMGRSSSMLDVENITEEFGDIEFYFEGACQGIGISIPRTVGSISEPSRLSTVPFYYFALLSSSGDFLDWVKKKVIYQKPESEVMSGGFFDSLTKVRSSLYWLYHDLNLTTEVEAKEANMMKLLKGDTARYKSGSYSDQQAQARVDKAGI